MGLMITAARRGCSGLSCAEVSCAALVCGMASFGKWRDGPRREILSGRGWNLAQRARESWTHRPGGHYTGHVQELSRARPARMPRIRRAASFQARKAAAHDRTGRKLLSRSGSIEQGPARLGTGDGAGPHPAGRAAGPGRQRRHARQPRGPAAAPADLATTGPASPSRSRRSTESARLTPGAEIMPRKSSFSCHCCARLSGIYRHDQLTGTLISFGGMMTERADFDAEKRIRILRQGRAGVRPALAGRGPLAGFVGTPAGAAASAAPATSPGSGRSPWKARCAARCLPSPWSRSASDCG